MTTKLGEKLRTLRLGIEGMTLDRLAKEAGMSKSYLWELENRDSPRPSAEKLANLASILKVNTEYFLDHDVREPEERHLDDAFFRKYTQLLPEDKEQVRRILETFRKGS